MKTGRPEYYLPSPTTVSRDVRLVFARLQQRIATLLRVSDCSKMNVKKAKTTYRNMMGNSILQPMPGHPPITEPMLH
jgi:hypothetical protein